MVKENVYGDKATESPWPLGSRKAWKLTWTRCPGSLGQGKVPNSNIEIGDKKGKQKTEPL